MLPGLYRTFSLAAITLSIAIATATASADTITASLFSPQAPNGATPTDVNLTGITAPSSSTIVGTGYTVTFSVGSGQGVVEGTLNPGHAVPVAGVTGSNTAEYLTGGYGSTLTTNIASSGNYLSTGTGTVTVTFSTPEDSLAVLWGSIDTGNSVTLNDSAHFDVTGSEVQAAAAGFAGNGFQGPGGSAWVVIDTSTPFTTATFSSSVVSFEFAAVAAANAPFNGPSGVPEPATWLLLGPGMGAVLLGRRYIAAARRRS